MARYFFDVDGIEPDDEGSELADLESARVEAIAILFEIATASPNLTVDPYQLSILVRDDTGAALFRQSLLLGTERLSDAT
jgi:hypothetical protein